ncbi:MAG: ATPase [Ruminococcus sp.]|nr:ATPase [Ruminococcus sp.]
MSEKYFLGAMTQFGFSTEFGKIIEDKENFTYILKGGPGTGKSSLMKKVAAAFEDREKVTRFCCSSDPESLDAVWLRESKTVIVDGTAPHVFDPCYPGCCQKLIDLGENWDEEELACHRDEIIELTDKNKSLLARAKRFSTALSNVCGDTYCCASSCINTEKLNAFLGRFMKKIFARHGSGTGRMDIRQLSALTEHGCMTQMETLEEYGEIYLLCDDYYSCAHLFVEKLAKEAIHRNYDVILCPAHAFNNTVYEHLLIPETGIALVLSSPLSGLGIEGANSINLVRFYDKDKLTPYKNRLKLNRLTSADLAAEVYKTIREAKAVHDGIESFYVKAMDFAKLDALVPYITENILKRTKS